MQHDVPSEVRFGGRIEELKSLKECWYGKEQGESREREVSNSWLPQGTLLGLKPFTLQD